MSNVSIQTNTASLMSALAVTFTDKTKVLSEIIQNSRRAGASQISIAFDADKESNTINSINSITITDDGKGISNMQDIFTIGGSGWDEATEKAENPYGIGSIAMLYACQSLHIKSRCQSLNVDCQGVINGNAFTVVDTKDASVGTTITLINTVFETKTLVDVLDRLAMYSSVPIILNGATLKSDRSLVSLQADPDYTCLDTPLGTIVYKSACTSSIKVILQEMVVYSQHGSGAYFFANNNIKARMPDRDKLVDETSVLVQIKSAMSDAYCLQLTSEKMAIKTDLIAMRAWVNINLYSIVNFAPHLLNDIPYLPSEAFSTVDYPNQRDRYDYAKANEVVKGGVNELTFISAATESPIIQAALHAVDAQYLEAKLDKGHWFYEEASNFEEANAVINVVNGRSIKERIYAGCDAIQLAVADELSVSYGSWTQAIQYGAFLRVEHEEFSDDVDNSNITDVMDEFGDCILVNTHEVETVLLQFTSFVDGNDNEDELYLQETVDTITNFATAAFGVSASDFITRVLPTIPTAIIEQLKTNPVTLSVDNEGVITATAA